MPRGGDRSKAAAAAGKKVGRPAREKPGKLRRDVAYRVLDALREGEKAVAKARSLDGELDLFFQFLELGDNRLKWDVYRYAKECVDGKPLTRSEEKILFDPNQPMRVLVEHIGSPRVRPQDQVPAKAK